MRNRARRATVPIDEPGPDGTTLADKLADETLDVAGRQRLMDVERALGNLSEEHRGILALRVDADLSYSDIAGVLDLPVGTVMSRLARAREALLEEVEKLRAARFRR